MKNRKRRRNNKQQSSRSNAHERARETPQGATSQDSDRTFSLLLKCSADVKCWLRSSFQDTQGQPPCGFSTPTAHDLFSRQQHKRHTAAAFCFLQRPPVRRLGFHSSRPGCSRWTRTTRPRTTFGCSARSRQRYIPRG